MAFRGGPGGRGGPMGSYRRNERASPYSRNGGGNPRDAPRGGGGGNRRGGRDQYRKRELTALSEGKSDNKEVTPQKPSISKDIPVADATLPSDAKQEPTTNETPSMNNSIDDRNINTPRSGNNSMSRRSAETPRSEKKSYVKSRLFVGNLPREMKENEVKLLFEEYGEVNEVFVSKDKMYGFVRMVSSCREVKFN